MSGIAGIYRRGGAVSVEQFESVLGTLDYRGHDGRDTYTRSHVALGHQHAWTTPQSVGERQPVTEGEVTVALAGRLDNRSSLAHVLPSSRPLEGTTDAELLAYAYTAWGLDCFERLLGAFGALIWDDSKKRLVLARDKTGIRHLFYGATGDVVVAGSDATTVRAHPAIDGSPVPASMATFLTDGTTADDATFYSGVHRLPPGTLAVADGFRTEQYWHPADEPSLRGESKSELTRRLRDAVEAAVVDRLRQPGRPGLFMSGGLDSTALAGVVSADVRPGDVSGDGERATPTVYSMVFESVDDEQLTGAERDRIRDVVARHDLDHRTVLADDTDAFADPSVFDRPLEESPYLEALQPAIDRLNRRAADAGHRVVLTGHGGDMFAGSRFAYADLLRRGKLLTLLRHARRDPMPTKAALKWYALVPSSSRLADRWTNADGGPPEWFGPRLRSCSIPNRTNPERFWSAHRKQDYRQLTGIRRDHKLHAAHRRAFRQGLTLRMPFLDARVVSLAYTIPSHQLRYSGEANALFRAAFADVLPESVLSIRKGAHFNAAVLSSFQRARDYLTPALTDTYLESKGYVRDGAPRASLEAYFETRENWIIPWRLYSLNSWVRPTKMKTEKFILSN